MPAAKLAAEGRCGACKAPLPAVAEPLEVDEAELRDIVAGAEVPVLVDFWAEWCGPCRMAAPHVARVASDLAGHALVLKVDTERHPALASAYGVRGIPNFVVIRRGQVVRQEAGLADARALRGWLEQAAT